MAGTLTFKSCLGVGGYGEVYLADLVTPGGLRREVAVKMLRTDNMTGDALSRLRDEAHLLSSLNHSGLLKVHDLVKLADRAALITDYIDGADLSVVIADEKRLPPRVALEIAGEVAAALDAAYSSPAKNGQPLRLVHRDVKPPNIRVGREGTVRLLDFGIAVSPEVDREAKTRSGLVAGTVGYLSPERVMYGPAVHGSDVHAVGLVLYEMITGERFFLSQRTQAGAADDEVYSRLVEKRMEIVPESGIKDLIAHMLAYDPNARPSARQVALECDRLVGEMPGAALKGWARGRAWKKGSSIDAPLLGQSMTLPVSGGVEPENAPPAVTRKATSATGGMSSSTVVGGVAAFGLLGMLGAGAVLLLALVAVFVVMSGALSADPPPEIVDVVEPPSVTPPVETVAVIPPDPVVDPPVAPLVVPVVTETPKPVATTPKPVAPPKPVDKPKPVATGQASWSASGAVSDVELRSSGDRASPGPISAGNWEIWADLGGGYTKYGSVTLRDGDSVVVKCSKTLLSCSTSMK